MTLLTIGLDRKFAHKICVQNFVKLDESAWLLKRSQTHTLNTQKLTVCFVILIGKRTSLALLPEALYNARLCNTFICIRDNYVQNVRNVPDYLNVFWKYWYINIIPTQKPIWIIYSFYGEWKCLYPICKRDKWGQHYFIKYQTLSCDEKHSTLLFARVLYMTDLYITWDSVASYQTENRTVFNQSSRKTEGWRVEQ